MGTGIWYSPTIPVPGNNHIAIAGLRFKFFENLPAKRFIKCHVIPDLRLGCVHVVPAGIGEIFSDLMQTIEDRNVGLSCSFDQFFHMFERTRKLQAGFHNRVQLPIKVKEVIERVNENDCNMGVHGAKAWKW